MTEFIRRKENPSLYECGCCADGGYFVCKKHLPAIKKNAEIFSNYLMGLLAFRLMCESESKDGNHGEEHR